MIQQEKLSYFFAGFELQPQERRLLQAGLPVPLTPKAFEILQFLIERAGHVVGKDELLAAIWPGRFVAESNLTKHIWSLRKALGESEEGGRYIETVSKTGYRFVAPVTRDAPAAIPASAPPAATLSATPSIWRGPEFFLLRIVFSAAVFGLVALALWWLWHGRDPVFPWTAGPPGTAVAIFEFENLSRSPKEAWIGPAFAEMLGTEVAQGGQLHLLPGELVRASHRNYGSAQSGGFGLTTLARLHRELAVDYVVTGSYLALEKSADPPVRLDLAVQDARSGATLATFSRSGVVGDLPALVSIAGADLRKDLSVRTPSRQEMRLAANAQPPSADVMRRIGFALDALHHYNPARARDELLQAVVEAPDYAPAYAWLAKAWSALGYKDKALAAARQAEAHSADLPQFMRLQIEAQSREAQYQWPQAIAALRALATLQEGDPEPRFELADALLAAGKSDEAQKVLDALRAEGEPVASDARLELAEARIAQAQDDTKSQQAHAFRALQLAQARDATGLAADAERQLGVSSSDPKASDAMLARALADYKFVGNPSGEAAVHLDIGNLYSGAQPHRARDEYRSSLAQYQAIGDRNGIASAYADLGLELWAAGDRDGAETAVRNVLQIRRETGDIAGQAWALAALAVGQSDDRAGDEAIAGFRQAAALDATIGAHTHRGFTLFSLSDILRLRGELVQAQEVCAEAKSEYTKVKDALNQSSADLECAQISLDRGDVNAFAAIAGRVRAAALQRRDAMTLGNVDTTEGQIRMGRGEWAEAARSLDTATREFAQGDMTTGEAVATSLMALCDAALGRTADSATAAERAGNLRSRVTERQEVFEVDIALAELRGSSNEDQAVSQLQELAADARQRLWPGWALEAELAELHVLERGREAARAKTLRAEIAAEAQRLGFGWVAMRLERA